MLVRPPSLSYTGGNKGVRVEDYQTVVKWLDQLWQQKKKKDTWRSKEEESGRNTDKKGCMEARERTRKN